MAFRQKSKRNISEGKNDSPTTSHKDNELVWAKLRGFKWWPALTLNPADCRRPSAKYGNTWVFWFGDYKVSEVSKKKVSNFVSSFQKMTKVPSSKTRDKAIMEVLKIIAKEAAFPFINIEDLYLWAKNGFTSLPQRNISLSSLPPVVVKHLQNLSDACEKEICDESNNSECESEDECNAGLSPVVHRHLENLNSDSEVQSCDELLDSICKSEDAGLLNDNQVSPVGSSFEMKMDSIEESMDVVVCNEENDTQIGPQKEIEIVWAKLPGFKWWPAVTIDSTDCKRPSAKDGNTWLFWFGDYKISEVSKQKISNFISSFPEMTKIPSSKSHTKAIIEALKIIAEMSALTFTSEEDLYLWAKDGFANIPEKNISFSCLPPLVIKYLKPLFEDSDEESSNESGDSESKSESEGDSGFCQEPQPEEINVKSSLEDTDGMCPIDSMSEMEIDCVEKSKESSIAEDAIQVSPRKDIRIIWAKLSGFKWWPAITIDSSDCRHSPAKYGYTWVFWFGDYKISEVSQQTISDFIRCFNAMTKGPSSKTRDKAIIEALKIIAEEAALTFTSEDDLYLWAKDGFQSLPSKKLLLIPSLPPLVLKHLKRFTETSDDESSDETDESESESEDESDDNDSSLCYEKLKSGEISFEKMCISCRKLDVPLVLEHPLFKGQICVQCKIMIRDTVFVLGDDEKNICCAVCGRNGLLILCDNLNCPRSYCRKCLCSLLSPSAFNTVMEASPWSCFFCSSNETKDCYLQLQLNWKERLLSLFLRQKPGAREPDLYDFIKKRPISVLSLFDGISTGKVVLDMLGIVVDKYFASEIDPGAINVSKFHHSDSIVYIGDILYISEKDIESFGHIDLVIGGSPCNDLSLVNPRRKGLFDMDGTGCLFFDFFHILNIIKRKNKNVFYLFENVAAMQVKDKIAISTFFMQEPAVVDAKYFSPQVRARYFWGNIPGLHSLTRCWTSMPSKLIKDKSLYECVYETLGRKAVVSKIRTVTTQINSMYQCKKDLLPVVMDGKPDVLWVTELEKVFGFPAHYTDTGNLSITQRRKLLGRAWSVPVIKKILQPLTNFFECK